MTDAPSVVSAYLVVLGGLILYVLSVVRRVQAARRASEAVRRERERDIELAAAPSPTLAPRPSNRSG